MLDRRDFIRRTTLILGGALSPACLRMLEGRNLAHAAAPSHRALSDAQRVLVAAAAERIIPRTDTPGAKDAGVPEFIEMMIADWMRSSERDAFFAGLASLDDRARKEHSKGYVDLSDDQQHAILAALEKEEATGGISVSLADAEWMKERTKFFGTLKELTVVGFYTSKTGVTEILEWDPIPGKHDTCIPAGDRDVFGIL